MTGSVSYGAQLGLWAKTKPDQIAILYVDANDEGTALTFRELDRAATALAYRLRELNVSERSMVVMGLPNSAEFFIALFAIWMVGGCPVPLRPDMPQRERDRLLALIRPDAMVADWTDVDVPRISQVELSRAGPVQSGPLPDVISPRTWAVTSGGSTGLPKLIVNLRAASTGGVGRFSIPKAGEGAATEIQLICGPLYHTHGLGLSVGSLLAGETIVLLRRFDAEQVARMIARHRVTKIGLVAIMLMRMLRIPHLESRDFSSLKLVLAGAGTIPAPIAEKWIELVGPENFIVGYGSSEGVGGALITGSELLSKPGSVGRGNNTEIRILDDDMRPCPNGTVGNIFLRSKAEGGLKFEYLGAPNPTPTADGFASIGDLGWLDDEGYLYIADRRTDMVKTGGVNVFPAEVESRLIEHPGVADVAVIGLADPEWGRRLHAIVVPSDPANPPTIEELIGHCRSALSATKIPKTFEYIDQLPRSDAMKLNRSALAEERSGREERAPSEQKR